MINLTEKETKVVQTILKIYVPELEVWAFGSRINGTNKSYSDLDLAVISQDQLPLKIKGNLKYAFEESDLPFRVDVLDWQRLTNEFKKIVQANHVIMQKPGT